MTVEKVKKNKVELVRLRAADGFRAKVYLNNKLISYVSEIIAAEKPNIPVQGIVVILLRHENGGYVLSQKGHHKKKALHGEVYWQPPET